MDRSKTYSITLADGTVLDGLTRPTNAFVSPTPIDFSIFEGNCYPVIISDGENEEIHAGMRLVVVPPTADGKQRFILKDVSPEEISLMKMQADIDYIAMKSRIEL